MDWETFYKLMGVVTYVTSMVSMYQMAPVGAQLTLDTPDLVIRIGNRRVRITSINTVVE